MHVYTLWTNNMGNLVEIMRARVRVHDSRKLLCKKLLEICVYAAIYILHTLCPRDRLLV